MLCSANSNIANTKEIHGIKILKKKHPAIKKLRKKPTFPSLYGHKLWTSSYLIMDYLNCYPPVEEPNTLELGCGWGILSIYCASNFNANVVAVDADKKVFPYLKYHARINDVKIKTQKVHFEDIKKSLLKHQDLILGSDICFWDELVDPLYKLIKKSMKADVGQIIIADPGRSPFLKLAKRCKKKMNARLIPWETDTPRKVSGQLLVINQ